MAHAPGDCKRWNGNFSCFKNERDLKVPKQVGTRAFRNFDKTMTWHALNTFVAAALAEDAFNETKLGMPRKQIAENRWSARSLMGPRGHIRRKDMVHWNEAGTCMVGTVLLFFAHGTEYFGQVARHVHIEGYKWRPAFVEEEVMVPAAKLSAVSYCGMDGIFYIRFPLTGLG